MNTIKNKTANCRLKTANLFSLLPTAHCILFLFLTFSIFHLPFTIALAEVRYVSKTGSSTPPYTTWETAADSIQKTINICNDGDTIIVANGVYKETIIVDKEIWLIGSSMDSTKINGTGLSNSFTVEFTAHGNIENFHIIGKGKEITGSYCLASFDKNVIANNCKLSAAESGCGFGSSSPIINNFLIYDVKKEAFYSVCSFDTCHQKFTNSIVIASTELWFNSVSFSFGGSPKIENNIIISEEGNVLTGIEADAFVNPIIRNNLVLGFNARILEAIVVLIQLY